MKDEKKKKYTELKYFNQRNHMLDLREFEFTVTYPCELQHLKKVSFSTKFTR